MRRGIFLSKKQTINKKRKNNVKKIKKLKNCVDKWNDRSYTMYILKKKFHIDDSKSGEKEVRSTENLSEVLKSNL